MLSEPLKSLLSAPRWLYLVLSFFIASQLHGQTQPKNPDDLYELVNVEGNLYLAGVRGPGGHTTAVLITPEGVIMADPINTDFAQWLKDQLANRFDAEVKYVIYSHHHPDHASGGVVFEDTASFVGHQKMNIDEMPSNFAALDINNNGLIELEETTVRARMWTIAVRLQLTRSMRRFKHRILYTTLASFYISADTRCRFTICHRLTLMICP